MLVRVGLALTCSVVAASVLKGNDKRRRRRNEESQSVDAELDTASLEAQQKTPAEEVKRVNASSPARSVRSVSETGGADLLLPEFDQLLSADLSGLSPRGSDERNNYSKLDFRAADHSKDVGSKPDSVGEGDDLGLEDDQLAVRRRILDAKSRAAGGKLGGGRRSPSPGRKLPAEAVDGNRDELLLPGDEDYLLGEYVGSLSNDAVELEVLRSTVRELREKELRMEGELLDLYALQMQEADIVVLERELDELHGQNLKHRKALEAQVSKCVELETKFQETTTQNTKLKSQISSLTSQKTKLADELAVATRNFKKDLDEARARNRELHKKIHTDAGQAKAELLILKQKLAIAEAREEEGNKQDIDTENKLQSLRELEVEVVELRRTNKELQHQKRELTVRMTAAESEVEYLVNRTESDVVAEVEADIAAVRHVNEDLAKQVEGLQIERFSEVEELVYLRWVNACLRYELRNFQAPPGKTTALDLSNNLSPKSQEKAKKLMLEYTGPNLLEMHAKEQAESRLAGGYESASSETSTGPSESAGEYSDKSTDLGSARMTKRPSLIRRLKNWTGVKEDGSEVSRSVSSSSLQHEESFSSQKADESAPHRKNSIGSKGPLEALILRNASDVVEITSYGAKTPDKEFGRASPRSLSDIPSFDGASVGSDAASSARHLEANLTPIKTKKSDRDASLSGVAASFQLMSKSVNSPEFGDRFPAFKDRHKAAVEREKLLKEKAAAEREKVLKAHDNVQLKAQELLVDKLPIVTLSPVEPAKSLTAAEVEKRALRKPNPPPKPSDQEAVGPAAGSQMHGRPGGDAPPPPPPSPPLQSGVPLAPPPPPLPPSQGFRRQQGLKNNDDMQRAPEVVEFYQSLMRRDARNNSGAAGVGGANRDARNNVIGEIENRSTHLLAIKADVETQGEFVQSLAAEVHAAVYNNIEDAVAFVTWLDDELSFLVDERAVLKHFDWPEGKADALREAAFEYQDLMKLQAQLSLFEDKPEIPCEKSLKRMLTMLEKVEHNVYGLLRTRDMAIAHYKDFGIPTQWMLDSGVVGQIKLASVKLARLYMKRVAAELDHLAAGSGEPLREFLLLQGVRFAFRVHQFAGGFDPESMNAFETLRACAHVHGNNNVLATVDAGDEC